ncbi:rod shape-determining protein MreC [Candidatus Parcubacteria bacterium]|nr:MAG: rod shape-determining protein MreC [Candidatus Parcubacteria bacterium]
MRKFLSNKTTTYLAVATLLIFLHFTHLLSPLERVVILTLNPVMGKLQWVGTRLKVSFNRQKDKRDFLRIIKELEEDNQKLLAENAKLKQLQEENEKLRQYLDFMRRRRFRYVMANIVTHNRELAGEGQGSIIIDRGSKNGLYAGLALVNSQGLVVGKIIEVKDSIARACLIIDKNCQIAAALQNKNKTSGVVRGELGLTIKMELIPQTEEIKEGEIVVTSGLEDSIPPDLVIGRISQVNKSNNEVWQEAILDSPLDFTDLTMVAVVLP